MKRLVLDRFAHVAFAAAAIVVLGLGTVLYQVNIRSTVSTSWVSHTLDTIRVIGEINAQFARSDSAYRAYLLSAANDFLSDRDRAIARVDAAVIQFKALTVDNQAQQVRTSRLAELLASRFAAMRERSRLRQSEGVLAMTTAPATESGRDANAQIFELTSEIEQNELQLLKSRRLAEEHSHGSTPIALVVLLLIALVVPGYVGLVVQARRRHRAERKLADMADNLPGAAFQLRAASANSAHEFQFVSRSVLRLFGIDRESLLRDPAVFWNHVFEEDRAACEAAIHHGIKHFLPVQFTFRIRHPSGETRWIYASASVRKEPRGAYLWNGYWADMTAEHLLRAALEEAKEGAESANRAKSIFLATMSHEIRTPMNGVLGMLELLSLTSLDGSQRTTLEVVRESGKSLQRIIDDILDFSKIEAGKLEIRPEATSIAAAITSVCDIFRGNAASKGLELRCSIDPHISPAVMVDPMRLRQILNNLVSNALKFTATGHVEIKAEQIGRADGKEALRLSVTDTGIGISVDDQGRLFQPFVQTSTATRDVSGTGLGLTICQRLASMMGGSIEMHSELGVGTTMILQLSLPLADPDEVAIVEPVTLTDVMQTARLRRMAPEIAQAESEGTLALLVDDHPTNRLLIVRQINLLGYAAESADNGREGLEKWKSGRFRLVITDCNMPHMNGYELARAIRQIESANRAKRTPIIACTANAQSGTAELCFAAGMDDYLAKPIELVSLAKKLDQWLPIKRSPTPLDRSVLAALTGGDADSEREILVDFRRVNDDDAAMLKRAVERVNVPGVATAAHRIKGASKMIGAAALATVCERLERACRANDWKAVLSSMDVFLHELERLNLYCEEDLCALRN